MVRGRIERVTVGVGLALSVAGCARPSAPAGVFTAAQAERGRAVYAEKCAACHGAELAGATAEPLAGPAFAGSWGPASSWAQLAGKPFTIDDLAFTISTTMPPGGVKALAPADHAAVVAYVLQKNGFPAGETPLEIGSPRLKEMVLDFAPPATPEGPAPPPPELVEGKPGSAPTGGGPTQAELNAAADATDSWLYHTKDYSGSRYSTLDQISSANVGRLQVACALQLGEVSSFPSGPIVHQGVMYVTTARSTVALDAATCRVKWRHQWTSLAREGWPNNRGVAIKDGWVVRGTPDGYLVALNAATGSLVWARRIADSSQGETITMPPLIYEDLVVIGPAGSENGISGWVGAFKLADGAPVWKFKTVPGAAEPGSQDWSNPANIKLGGGAVWTPMSFDPATGDLHVAVTNPAPDFAADLRPGPNLYTNSIVALDVRTGTLRWHKQLVPNDSHDWDLTQVSPIFTASIGGKPRRLVATAGKDGVLRTLDRDSHEVLYSTPVTTIENVEEPVTVKGTRACPGVLGGVQWNGPAYNPRTGMLYTGAVDWCTTFWASETTRYIPGRLYMGGTSQLDPTAQGWITAVDAVSGAVTWKYRSPEPVVSGITTTAGNVVLAGEVTGDFIALDARTGAVLYRFNTGGSIGGGVVTYAIGGRQYVAVASGRAGLNFLRGNPGTPTVFVFALPR